MTLDSAALRYLDQFLFIALPYLAFAVFFIGTIQHIPGGRTNHRMILAINMSIGTHLHPKFSYATVWVG